MAPRPNCGSQRLQKAWYLKTRNPRTENRRKSEGRKPKGGGGGSRSDGFERSVPPHPSPLPEAREPRVPSWCNSGRPSFSYPHETIPPLPKEEGRGEGGVSVQVPRA